jgi:hypothetical protein
LANAASRRISAANGGQFAAARRAACQINPQQGCGAAMQEYARQAKDGQLIDQSKTRAIPELR